MVILRRIVHLIFKTKGFSRSSTYTLHICSQITNFSEGDSLTAPPIENAGHKLRNTSKKINELEKLVLCDFSDVFCFGLKKV